MSQGTSIEIALPWPTRPLLQTLLSTTPTPRPERLKHLKYLQGAVLLTVVALASVGAWRLWDAPNAKHPGVARVPLRQAAARRPEAVRKCDVLVIGGTPSGIAAALAASRRGARVILCEERAQLGGDISYALLNMFDVPINRQGHSPVATGIFGEVFRELGTAFDVRRAVRLFDQKIAAQPGISLLRRTRVVGVLKRGSSANDRVIGARLAGPDGKVVRVLAGATVDATNDADFATHAGASSFIGRAASGIDGRMQAAGLLFEIAGANWNAMRSYAAKVRTMPVAARVAQENASDAAPTTSKHVAAASLRTPEKQVRQRLGGGGGGYLWESGEVVKAYRPHGANVMVLSINFGRQQKGSVILNTLNVLGVNGLNPASKAQGHKMLAAELRSFIPYLRGAMPGMKHAQLKRVAPELYVRETRHVQGFTTLEVSDIRAQRVFPDAVARVSYPIDLHPYEKGDFNPYGPRRYFYTLPLRTLIPKRVDGVFVASRCLSASYDAAGSARVIPITMAAGEASGVAAFLCAKNGRTPHQMAKFPAWWQRVRQELRTGGADVG